MCRRRGPLLRRRLWRRRGPRPWRQLVTVALATLPSPGPEPRDGQPGLRVDGLLNSCQLFQRGGRHAASSSARRENHDADVQHFLRSSTNRGKCDFAMFVEGACRGVFGVFPSGSGFMPASSALNCQLHTLMLQHGIECRQHNYSHGSVDATHTQRGDGTVDTTLPHNPDHTQCRILHLDSIFVDVSNAKYN